MDTKGVQLGKAKEEEGEEEGEKNSMAMVTAREYRRGNWTVPETMVLIEAKKRVHGDRHPADQGLARWRWVEDYCWRCGCRRSQNQCNDRWDNLMRDYKKVRAYELAGSPARGGGASYWAMGKAERKERGLPSNLLREIYEAMGEVVERRMSCVAAGSSSGGLLLSPPPSLLDVPMQASPLAQVLPRPLEEETNCSSESPERKRRRPSMDDQPGSSAPAPARQSGQHQRERAHGGGDDDESTDDDDDEVGGGLSGAIGQSAAILSGALESREAAEERRHREVMAVEERRSRARQARRDAGEQCVAGLAAAVSQLAGSMLALAAKHKGPAAPK